MDIKDKTIFDFCKDENMRKEIIGGDYDEGYYKGFPKINIYNDILSYAVRVHNNELCKAAIIARNEAQREFEEQADEAMKGGLLID